MVDKPTERAAVGQDEPDLPHYMPAWIPKWTYVLAFIFAVFVLVTHTFKSSWVQVDTTTLGLLAILLLVPLAPYITRLKAGGVEAEIGPRDAKRVQAAGSELPPASATAEKAREADPGAPTLQELIERDPPLGLAKLRIDLERVVRDLYLRAIDKPMRRGLTLGPMIRELQQAEVLPPEVVSALVEVNRIGNRAVHGEFVPTDVAEVVADVGFRLLGVLQDLNDNYSRPDA